MLPLTQADTDIGILKAKFISYQHQEVLFAHLVRYGLQELRCDDFYRFMNAIKLDSFEASRAQVEAARVLLNQPTRVAFERFVYFLFQSFKGDLPEDAQITRLIGKFN